jgi:NADPH2:quinone reductase
MSTDADKVRGHDAEPDIQNGDRSVDGDSQAIESAGDKAAFLNTPPRMMRSVYYDDYGAADVLRIGNLQTPKPRPGQLLVRVMATSVNPIDYRLRRGEMRYLLRGHFPRIPGFDVSGYVVDAGNDPTLRPGDRVLAFLDSMYGGASAQYAVMGADAAALIPDALSFEEAAALPLAGSTALQSLRDHGHLRPGDRVLINGASGGVGGIAVQVAKRDGAHVTAVASEQNRQYVMSLGADTFIDYRSEDFTQSDQRWNLIFDAAGKSNYATARKVLTNNGRFVSTEPNAMGILQSFTSLVSSQRCRVMLAKSNRRDLSELVRLYESGALRPMVDDVLAAADAAQAHWLCEEKKVRGKLVMRMFA